MRSNQEPRLVLAAAADLHLSIRSPVARSAEENWIEAQTRQLDQLRKLVVSPTGDQKVPVVLVGDVFDSYRQPPEVINAALSHLPQCHGVYGNHELPNHDPGSLRRSAWWTLVKAGKIIPLESGRPIEVSVGKQPVRLHGFPFGSKIKPLQDPHDMYLEVAVVHEFLWVKGKGYEGAPDEKRLKHRWKDLRGYDVVFYGDNHVPFDVKGKQGLPYVCNLGGFYRRKRDEIEHRPSVALLYSDGSVKRRYLDVSSDKFLTMEGMQTLTNGIGFESFIQALGDLSDAATDFAETVKRLLERKKVPLEVKRCILQALETRL